MRQAFDNIPQPEALSPVETILVHKAQQLLDHWRNSPHFVASKASIPEIERYNSPSCIISSPRSRTAFSRYTDRYKKKPPQSLSEVLKNNVALKRSMPDELFQRRLRGVCAVCERVFPPNLMMFSCTPAKCAGQEGGSCQV